ncbi:hypothetical protein Sipo8835_15805 [Streptomyces ipomoeae]|uniref:Uncharacterized protein n=1 Tax=Streptomyces ipomoeae TaxID=103232 RepID=A0AAE8W2M0_9ACTN|nr:hypothetical protein [Streptomyces ipomoeae]TQE34209.1 hypothetical protein Sipo8835_15805 [Streptomyces ipomoeae]
MPEPLITIAIEPSGRVSARGADALAATLLRRAGFTEINDWHGLRHRMPLASSSDERVAVAGYAAQMLRAARYRVDIDPQLDPDPPQAPTPTDPLGRYAVGRAVLDLTDQVNAATTAGQAADVLDQILDPADGVLIRCQEVLEAAAEKCNDFDEDGNSFELSDRFTAAAEQLTQIGHDLDSAAFGFRALEPASPTQQPQERSWQAQAQVAAYKETAVTSAARATSPATRNTPGSGRQGVAPDNTAAQPAAQPTRRAR